MKRLLALLALLCTSLHGAVTDIVIPQRDTATTFLPVTITGSTNVGKAVGFGPGGILEAITVGGSVATDTLWNAAGDLAVGTGSDTATRLGIGTALQVLRVNAGATALEWAAAAVTGAPTDATYITQTANGTLSAEQALSALATGVLKNTTTTGVLSIAAAGTDYVAPGGALGTPSSGTVTNLTGTASININGTVGATTPAAGTFTTATATTLAGAGGGITLTASGFNGNLTTTDNTLQEVAQKLDDLTVSGSPGGSDTHVQYNDGGVLGGEAGFTYNKTTNVLTVPNLTSAGTVDLSAATVSFGTLATLPVTSIELGHASANTLTASSGVLSVEGVAVAMRTGGNTFTGTQVFPSGQALIAPALGTIGSGVGTALTALQHLANGNDPDLSTEGDISYDANGDVLRAYDGANQIAIGRKIEAIHVTVVLPNDLADSERDAFWVWSNESGMSFVVTGWKGWSDTDDTTLNIEEIDADGQNNATVDAVEIATNGTGLFTGADTTITAATIENGHLLVLDFDDTDTPGQVKISIMGYFLSDVP